MKKQTAFQWLIEQWPILESQLPSWLIDQAKEMEKEQIIDANRDGVDMCMQNLPFITGEQYYNETFKSE